MNAFDSLQVKDWLFAMGGSALLDWIRNPLRPLYLYGPPATGKTMFQRAWHHSRHEPFVITGQDEDGSDLAFFNSTDHNVEFSDCIRIKACRGLVGADPNFGYLVTWLREAK